MKDKADWTPKWNTFKTVKIREVPIRWRKDRQNPGCDVMEIDYARIRIIGLKRISANEIRLVVVDKKPNKKR